jgi:hypothetical protein
MVFQNSVSEDKKTFRENGKEKALWPKSASELYRPTERPPLVGEVSDNFRGWCHVVRVMNPYVRILGFLDRSRYFFFQVAL